MIPANTRAIPTRPDAANSTRRSDPISTCPLVVLDHALLTGPQGVVYGPLSGQLDTPVSFVVGPHGSGRTSLLLSIAGRMHPRSGRIHTFGHDAVKHGRQVRHLTGVAGFDPIDQLEGSATVAEALHERLVWTAPWYRRRAKPAAAEVDRLLVPVFGAEVNRPAPDQLLRSLDDVQNLLFRIALALIERPRLLLVDDIDAVSSPHWRELLLDRVVAISGEQLAVIAGTADERDLDSVRESNPDLLRLGTQRPEPGDDAPTASYPNLEA